MGSQPTQVSGEAREIDAPSRLPPRENRLRSPCTRPRHGRSAVRHSWNNRPCGSSRLAYRVPVATTVTTGERAGGPGTRRPGPTRPDPAAYPQHDVQGLHKCDQGLRAHQRLRRVHPRDWAVGFARAIVKTCGWASLELLLDEAKPDLTCCDAGSACGPGGGRSGGDLGPPSLSVGPG
jgi:hypothetical protein